MTHSATEKLENLIKSRIYVDVEPRIINDSFPHIKRPTANEMEFAVNRLVQDKSVPEQIMVKIETKPTKEMLKDFCRKRGLSCRFDPIKKVYRFWVEEFRDEK